MIIKEIDFNCINSEVSIESTQQQQYQHYLQQLHSFQQLKTQPPPPQQQITSSICTRLNKLLSEKSLFAVRKGIDNQDQVFTFLQLSKNSMQKLVLELNADESVRYIAGNSSELVQISDSVCKSSSKVPIPHTHTVTNGIVTLKINIEKIYNYTKKVNMDRFNLHEFRFYLLSEESLPFKCMNGSCGSKKTNGKRIYGWTLPTKMQLAKSKRDGRSIIFDQDGVKLVRTKTKVEKVDNAVKKRKLQ